MMNPFRSKSTDLLRVGVSVLLAVPTGALPTGGHHLTLPGTTIHAVVTPVFQEGDGTERADDPIERIFWQTRDVAVPQVEETPPAEKANPFGGMKVAIDDHALDEIRGGFEFADANLKVSFGIERAVFVNGRLVASSVLNFKDLQWSAGAGRPSSVPLPNGAASIGLIQNGPGNVISTRLDASLAGTIIQNTLNDQKIQNVTTINASLNSGQLMRSIAIQSAVHNAIVDSLRR